MPYQGRVDETMLPVDDLEQRFLAELEQYERRSAGNRKFIISIALMSIVAICFATLVAVLFG